METAWTPPEIFRLDVKEPVRLLQAVFNRFGGENVTVVLQGDLTYLDTEGLTIRAQEPEAVVTGPKLSKNVTIGIALTPGTRQPLEKSLFTRAGIHARINHALVIQNDELVFAAFDRFCADCVWVTAAVGDSWPLFLKEAKIIAGFQRLPSMREPYRR
jgi:hypothetical protein